MNLSLLDFTSPDVRAAIHRSPIAVLPFGSVEQHGPHLPCGTDVFAAELLAAGIAERLEALLVPCCPYGITPIHAGHPGTISLRPSTFEELLRDVCAQLVGMGIEVVVFVNWHEGNNASLDRVANALQDELDAIFVVAHACYVAQRVYQPEGGELTHGGGIETVAVMAYDASLVRWERVGVPSRPDDATELDAMRRSHEVYGFVTDVTELAADGWYGDPAWATSERAQAFVATIAEETTRQIREVTALQQRRRSTHRPADEEE